LAKDEEKIMSATSLERVMQRHGCTTIEELKNKRQELVQAANTMAQMSVYAHTIKDSQLAKELSTPMTDNSIKLSEIEKVLRDL
jgi:CRISPR/Cas system-associated protein endoribonuclease Cas2